MTAGVGSGGVSDHPVWTSFIGRHSGDLLLGHDSLYALSEPLIEAIQGEASGFFTEEQLRFERDLTQTASFGFFLGRPLGAAAEEPGREGQPSPDERWEKTDREIKAMLAEELRDGGADDVEVDEFFERDTSHRDKVVARQDAYAGWLILDPVFHSELRQFRDRWGSAVAVAGRFPVLPMRWLPDPTEGVELPAGFRDECYRFYCRWGLDTLRTWDWPVPMEPDRDIGQRRNIPLLSSGGVFLFLLWYMLRGEALDLREVVRKSRLASAPDHLLDWVTKRTNRKGDNLGDVRFGTIRWLYRYYELVLRRRYPGACRNNLHRLDRAFARVLGRDEDLVRKLRQELVRGLKQAGADQPSA